MKHQVIGIGLLTAFVFLSMPTTASAQSICYACHASHGDIWKGDMTFHGSGVGHCSLCHTMHNSQDGQIVDPAHPGGNQYLLNSNPNDVCLVCHGGAYGNVFGSNPQIPPYQSAAGNFVFLLEDNINDGPGGAAAPIDGDRAGHNISSADRGSAPDRIHTSSPGGDFPADKLACTSCHDPHGNQNFRMLYGPGEVQAGLYSFMNDAPLAEGLSIYHGSESPSRHSAYQAGMSEWCANCHPGFHEAPGAHKHVSGLPIGPDIADRYNSYNGSIDPMGGSLVTAYIPEVPFEDLTAVTWNTAGPGPDSQVMCLSCHRGHATSAPDALRWDPNVTFLADDGLESGSYAIPSPYPNPAQRSLCNKCHVKDFGDAIPNP